MPFSNIRPGKDRITMKLHNGYYKSKINRQKALTGFLFSLPTIFGLVVLFCLPMLGSLRMAFSQVSPARDGSGLLYQPAGLSNFFYAFREHPDFTRKLVEAVQNMAFSAPVILFMSFFCAILLNQKFHGRAVARVIFFLPIIYASSAMLKVDSGDVMQQAMQSGTYKSVEASAGFLQSFEITGFIQQFGLPAEFTDFLNNIVNQAYHIITLSGVQTLIMLAALQSISPSLYEAAHVEGAGGFEKFWLITFPMCSSALLLCLIYSIIDSFVAYNNPIVLLTQQMMNDMRYGYSAAMSWTYFIVVTAILGVVALIGSRFVFTYDKRR